MRSVPSIASVAIAADITVSSTVWCLREQTASDALAVNVANAAAFALARALAARNAPAVALLVKVEVAHVPGAIAGHRGAVARLVAAPRSESVVAGRETDHDCEPKNRPSEHDHQRPH
jgi:hypothetical protein